MSAKNTIEHELFEICGAPEYGVDTEETAERIIAALSAAGFVIVPREPTNKMLQAHPIADLLPAEAVLNRRREVYRAMLSAAEGKQ